MRATAKIEWTEQFEQDIKSIKDKQIKKRISKKIEKMINNPHIGKPLRYDLKGKRTIYVKPYRLIYAFDSKKIILLRFLHRDEVYR